MWLLMLMAFLAASPLALQAGSTLAVPPASPTETGEESHAAPTASHCDERFIASLSSAIPAKPQVFESSINNDPLEQFATQLRNEETEAHLFIATLPDPIDSGYDYMFQGHLHAIQLGIEANLHTDPGEDPGQHDEHRFYRVGEWLPWYDTLESAKKESEACRHDTPGFLAFRGKDASTYALVLLVGETPTQGIHAGAMKQALNFVSSLTNPKSEVQKLKILSPTFSGSVASLKHALETFESDLTWEVSIISGTATGGGLRERLTHIPGEISYEPEEQSCQREHWFPHGKVEFWTTTVPEDVLQCRYLAYLCHSLQTDGQAQLDDGSLTIKQNCPELVKEPPEIWLPHVALLHESGTQFGTGAAADSACKYRTAFHAEFPANIAALRDEYEKRDSQLATKKAARATNLEVSLRESRKLPGMRGAPSAKALFAQDLALSRTIAALERQQVTHIGIQATEIADAIFLSRKIRDVAPDMRIAVFQADTLLLHPDFRSLLQGSLVITPYPFLGASDLDFESTGSSTLTAYRNFENSGTQGVFNATLALRGAKTDDLWEYALKTEPGVTESPRYSVLPVWIAAIGANRFVPLSVAPNTLKHNRKGLRSNPVYPGLDGPPSDVLSTPVYWSQDVPFYQIPPLVEQSQGAGQFLPQAKRFVHLSRADSEWRTPFEILHKRERSPLSRRKPALSWGSLALLIGLLLVVDVINQLRTWQKFADVRLPRQVTAKEERAVDLAAVRLKWNLYAVVRTGVGILAIFYLCFWATKSQDEFSAGLGFRPLGIIIIVLVAWCLFVLYHFSRDLWDFWRASSKELVTGTPLEPRLFRWLRDIGLMEPTTGLSMARVSQYQTFTLVLGVVLVGGYLLCAHWRAFSNVQIAAADIQSEWARTLMIERTLTLVGGVSAATPTLLLSGVLYLWARSRMAHLRLAHSVSRMTPPDRVADFVSTPIRMILYPSFAPQKGDDKDSAFTLIERSSVNAIIRPMTGPGSFLTLAGLLLIPPVLFMPSPISTLEKSLHLPLVTLLYVGYGLIVCTLLQLFRYWSNLELLLKSIFQHSLGRAFGRVAPFVRESLDEQVSRTPNDLLRLAACIGEYENIQRWANKPNNSIAKADANELKRNVQRLVQLREDALESLGPEKGRERATQDAELGHALIQATSALMLLVEKERRKQATLNSAAASKPGQTQPCQSQPYERCQPYQSQPEGSKARAEYHKDNAQWINDVEAFAATVVTILINRHVRHLQIFVYPLLISTILFMGAILSYPFEPHRLMTSFAWALILVSAFASVWTYLQLDRNSLLSHIASSDPGRITNNAGLIFRVLAWGVAPVLAALAADYPDLINTLFKWIRPIPIWQ